MREVNPVSPIGTRYVRPRQAIALICVLTAALTLGACGGSSKKKATTTAATTSASAPSTSQTTASTPAQTTTAPAHALGSVDVSLKEYTISPTPATGKAGTVSFSVHNDGQVAHEFLVVKTPKQAGALATPGGSGEASEQGNVSETGTVLPGANKTLKAKLAPGHYVLLCNLPGHYKAGQSADFTVR